MRTVRRKTERYPLPVRFPQFAHGFVLRFLREAVDERRTFLKTQRTDHSATPVAPFTEQELMRILEVQQLNAGGDQPQNAVTQTDIDKLFD